MLIPENVIKSVRLCSWCSDDFRQLDLHANDSICWLLNFLALGYTVRVLQVLQTGRNLFAVSRTKGYKELCEKHPGKLGNLNSVWPLDSDSLYQRLSLIMVNLRVAAVGRQVVSREATCTVRLQRTEIPSQDSGRMKLETP